MIKEAVHILQCEDWNKVGKVFTPFGILSTATTPKYKEENNAKKKKSKSHKPILFIM